MYMGVKHMKMKPQLGTMWKQHDLVVEIVNRNHPEYKQWCAEHDCNKKGDVIYIYRRGTTSIGKVGCFQAVDNFLKVWSPC
jgi:hypothetical protein